MGRIFLVELDGRAYRCRFCDSPLALADDIISRSFSCRRGGAYLFSTVVNITLGPEEERLMLSGLHTVEDIFCCCCGQILGWKYVWFLYLSGLVVGMDGLNYSASVSVNRWRIEVDVAEEFNLDAPPGSTICNYYEYEEDAFFWYHFPGAPFGFSFGAISVTVQFVGVVWGALRKAKQQRWGERDGRDASGADRFAWVWDRPACLRVTQWKGGGHRKGGGDPKGSGRVKSISL
ncbi:unnamed protein product [Prunus armeniaca]